MKKDEKRIHSLKEKFEELDNLREQMFKNNSFVFGETQRNLNKYLRIKGVKAQISFDFRKKELLIISWNFSKKTIKKVTTLRREIYDFLKQLPKEDFEKSYIKINNKVLQMRRKITKGITLTNKSIETYEKQKRDFFSLTA